MGLFIHSQREREVAGSRPGCGTIVGGVFRQERSTRSDVEKNIICQMINDLEHIIIVVDE